MKLIQNTATITYQILADYTEITKESPLISILKVCKELGNFSVIELQEFLKPLNQNAIANILIRLKNLEYLHEYEQEFNEPEYNYYTLTQIGVEVCETDEIEEEKRGVLNITVAYPKNSDSIIVKIEAVNKDEFQEEKKILSNASKKFDSFINRSQQLKNGDFKLKNVEDKYVMNEEKKNDYTFTFQEDSNRAQLLDFSKMVKVPKHKVLQELLVNAFEDDYDQERHLIRKAFNPDELSLKRKILIEKPKYDSLYFNKVELEKRIQISPLNQQEAKQWFLKLVISRIENYFLSDASFNDFVKNIAIEFIEYKASLHVSRAQLITHLSQPEDFYKKAKLDTINYLTY